MIAGKLWATDAVALQSLIAGIGDMIEAGTGDAGADHRVAVVQQLVAQIGRIIANEAVEQRSPIVSGGARLDIVRIARTDAARHGG